MAEPPAKRQRRPDSAAMWAANNTTSRHSDRDRRPREPPREDGRRGEKRHRSRSRDRYERRERSRERERERDKDRDRDRDRNRDRDRDRGHGRRDETRRSRSPHRDGTNGVRTRSPPRGPRDRPRDNPPPLKSSSGLTQPSSRALPSKNPPPTPPTAKSQPDTVPNGTSTEDGGDDWEVQMRRTMGFASFRSTKNTKVPGNDKNYGVRKEKKTEYRQYMNRVGGFNRPLSPG